MLGEFLRIPIGLTSDRGRVVEEAILVGDVFGVDFEMRKGATCEFNIRICVLSRSTCSCLTGSELIVQDTR